MPEPPVTIDPDRSLVSQIEGFSPALSREFLYRMQNGQTYEKIYDEMTHSDLLYRTGKEFHVLPFEHLQTPRRHS